MGKDTATGQIASFASTFDPERLDESELRIIALAIADTVAVAIAARREDAATVALNYARSIGGGAPVASVWGSTEALSIEASAFYNGFAAHLLDYDDVSIAVRGHVSACLVPALLALAEAENVSDARVMSAFHVGFEVACKLGRWLAHDLQRRGWHPTPVIGVVAAAAACGHLLGLTAQQLQHGLGLACAQACGTQESFGTMTKAFNVGHVAGAAIRAVKLARSGFTSSSAALEGPHGLARLYAAVEEAPQHLGGLGRDPSELLASGIETKAYPNCFATHCAADAAFALRRQHDFVASDVVSLRVRTSAAGLRPLIKHLPRNGLEAKFSLHYAVALALVDGSVRLSSFDDAHVSRPDLQVLMGRMDVAEDAGDPEPIRATVSIDLTDGSVLEWTKSTQDRGGQAPSTEAVEAKVSDCFAWGGCGGDAHAFVTNALALPTGSVTALLATTH